MEIRIREARLEDKERIIEFLKETSPDDYIFYVLDDWLKDENGKVLIAEHGNKVVAMNHFFVRKLNGWLEGARVHKEYRGKGIATNLALKSLEYLAKMNVKKARLVTNSKNIPAQRHLSRTPFREVSRWLHAHYNNPKIVDVKACDEYSEVKDFLENSKLFNSFGRVMHIYYSWFDFDPDFLKERIEMREVFFDGSNLVIITASHRRVNHYSISYLECEPSRLIEFFDIAYSLAKKKFDKIEMLYMIPAINEYRNKLIEEKIDFSELLLYEANILCG